MKGKVLVIEDDKDWQANLKSFLEIAGFYVEVVSDLQSALSKVQERFHFITIDMQLNESNLDAEKYEGWDILEIITRLRIYYNTPTMVITGFEKEYTALKSKKKIKKLDSIYFMGKGKFDRSEFIATVEKAVKDHDLRFKDDHRDE